MHRMMQRVEHATTAQEEEGLEECMCEEVEHARARAIHTARYTKANEHVAKLADRREGQHALEVSLCERTHCCIDSGDAANPGNDLESVGRVEREGACHHVDASRDHGRRVDERA